MTTKELIKELVGKESGWCLCGDPFGNLVDHMEEPLVEKVFELGVLMERERCRQIATGYEGGPKEGAAVAGSIRIQIETGVDLFGMVPDASVHMMALIEAAQRAHHSFRLRARDGGRA